MPGSLSAERDVLKNQREQLRTRLQDVLADCAGERDAVIRGASSNDEFVREHKRGARRTFRAPRQALVVEG